MNKNHNLQKKLNILLAAYLVIDSPNQRDSTPEQIFELIVIQEDEKRF